MYIEKTENNETVVYKISLPSSFNKKEPLEIIHVLKSKNIFIKNDFQIENLKNFVQNNNEMPIDNFIEEIKKFLTDIELNCTELSPNYKFKILNTNSNVVFNRFIENIGILICSVINVEIKCNRCNLSFIATQHIECCPGCNNQISIVYIPVFDMHFLGFFSVKNASLLSFLKNRYQLSCSNCNSNYQTKYIGKKERWTENCHSCHKKLIVEVQRIELFFQQKIVLQQGKELPNKGTCKHYSKSNRWFRFPCCKLLFPCDNCHNEKMNHAAEIADKMVCGFCSKEQSSKLECACGMSMKKKSSKFWEGGKGNRNKQTMCRKDSKKFSRK